MQHTIDEYEKTMTGLILRFGSMKGAMAAYHKLGLEHSWTDLELKVLGDYHNDRMSDQYYNSML